MARRLSTPDEVKMPSTSKEAIMADMATKSNGKPTHLQRLFYNAPGYKRGHKHKKHNYRQTHRRLEEDYEVAQRAQYRQERALNWWRAWEHLQVARHIVDVRSAWQSEHPNPLNSLCLHEA